LKRENPRLNRGQVKVSYGLGGDEPASDIIDVINDFVGGVLAGYAGAGRDHFCEAALHRSLLFDPNADLLDDLAPGDPLPRQELRVSADDDPTVWATMPAKRSLELFSRNCDDAPFDNRHHFRCCTASHPVPWKLATSNPWTVSVTVGKSGASALGFALVTANPLIARREQD